MVTREQIVAEARRWEGTPYRLGAEVCGGGCDCATLLLGIYRGVGIVTEEHVGLYGHDWFHHATEERYLLSVMRHAHKVAEGVCHRSVIAAPGCIVLTKCAHSKRYNHGGIVMKWPKVMHATVDGVREIDASRDPMWEHMPIAIFDPIPEFACGGVVKAADLAPFAGNTEDDFLPNVIADKLRQSFKKRMTDSSKDLA
jgi:cell wall-associated NlpC family hydrolase